MNIINTKLGPLDVHSLGEWDDLDAAANGLAMIYNAVAERLAGFEEDAIDEIKHQIWDDWGSDEKLMDMDIETARTIAKNYV